MNLSGPGVYPGYLINDYMNAGTFQSLIRHDNGLWCGQTGHNMGQRSSDNKGFLLPNNGNINIGH